MTALLSTLFGRLPIGWLQLIHNRTRFAAALAGVAFANILIFMQLGFLGALMDSAKLPYGVLSADIMISSSDANTLSDGSNMPRQRMYQTLAVPGVADATAVYFGRLDWKRQEGDEINLHVFGFDPAKRGFTSGPVSAALDHLTRLDVALIDQKTRNIDQDFLKSIDVDQPYVVEVNGRTLTVVGTFEAGAGFEADGYMVVSDQTFFRLFPRRLSGTPSHVLVDVEQGTDPLVVVERLRQILPAKDTLVRTLQQAADDDQAYQSQKRPIGVVFGFGVMIGVLVGLIIVYQVLSSDVADHLSEYATLKAVGYGQRFFLGIVFEEALVLALFGFVPGVLISLVLYQVVALATDLPVTMTGARPFIVLLGTLMMCMASGAIATRRLGRADPADLF